MALRGLVLPIAGDPSALLKAFKRSENAAQQFGREIHKTGISAKQSAQMQVQAAVKTQSRLRAEVAGYKQVGAAAKHGSREQVAAAQLAARAEEKLAKAIGTTRRETRQFSRSSARAQRALGRGGRGALAGSGAFRGIGRSLAFASGGFLAGASVTAGLRAVVTQASILQEETEKTTVLFGKSEKQVQQWSRSLASSFGVSEETALESAGVFGNMFRSLHYGEQPAAKMSERMVELAADMASFNNASPEDTLKALQSGLAGQVRPLRAYGVFLSIARIKQEAVSSGIVKNAAHLTTAQKVQAAYNIILRDTALQHGDVARNSESLSVAQSKLRANLQDSEAVIGRALLPNLVKLANAASQYLNRVHRTGELQRNVNNAVRVTVAVVRGLAQAFRIVRAVLSPFVHLVGGAKNAAVLASLAFLVMRTRAIGMALGLSRANLQALVFQRRMMGLTKIGKITIAVAFATEAYGPMKKFFEEHLGADYRGLSKKGDTIAGVKTDTKGQRARNVAQQARAAGLTSAQVERVLRQRGFSHAEITAALAQPSGEDVRLRGFTADTQGATTAPGATGGGRGGRLGLKGQFAKLELAQAQAALTKEQADDRAVYEKKASNLRAQIATGRGTLAERTALNEQLGGVLDQIRSIDEATVNKRKQHAEAEKQARSKELTALKDREKTLRGRIKDIQASFKTAVDTAREGIGELFAGPVLNPSEDANKRILGLRGGGGTKVSTLTADLRAQTAQFATEQKDLARLKRRGASPELLKELRAGGDTEKIHALATAPRGVLQSFLKAFGAREKLAIRTARTEMRSQLVNLHAARVNLRLTRAQERRLTRGQTTNVYVTLDGKDITDKVTVRQQRNTGRTAAQRRGRHEGTVHGIH